MIISVGESYVYNFVIFNNFYYVVRFIICSCVCMKNVMFVFWSCEFVRVYIVFMFGVGFNYIIDQSFMFGDVFDWNIFGYV